MPYSLSGTANAPNVAVSTTSTPTREERFVHAGDEIRPGQHQDLVAALEVRSTEIVRSEVLLLHVRSEGTVVHHDPFVDEIQERASFSHCPAQATGGAFGEELGCRPAVRCLR